MPTPHDDSPETADLDDAIVPALPRWDLPAGCIVECINISENHTFLVRGAGGYRAVLRVHRPGYHSKRAIECELHWLRALKDDGLVSTPAPIPGRDGELVQLINIGEEPSRYAVLFEFVAGEHPSESDDLERQFERLGRIAARTHVHSLQWQRPQPFERLTWDNTCVFGDNPTWGNWRDAPNITGEYAAVLERLEVKIVQELTVYGQSVQRFGLIHADMRLANVLVDAETIHLIDFDDCGFGWFMYDFAAAISFIEDHPDVPKLKAAWLAGYQSVRALSEADIAIVDTLIMLRRMALLAWIGSHIEAPEPQALAPDFARVTVELARGYLDE